MRDQETGTINYLDLEEISRMGNLANAGAGLKKMYIASVGALICVVLAFIPVVNILAAVGALVFMVMSMIGLHQTGNDIEGCRTAFTLTIVNIIISVVGAFFHSGIMHIIVVIAGYLISVMVTYLVCKSVGEVMNRIGAMEAARKGETAWKINAVCYVLLTVIAVAQSLPVFGFLTSLIGSLIVLVLSVIASVFYMLFLGQSSHALSA